MSGDTVEHRCGICGAPGAFTLEAHVGRRRKHGGGTGGEMRRHKRRRDGTCAIEGEGHDRDSRLWMPPDGWCVMWDERGDDERLAR